MNPRLRLRIEYIATDLVSGSIAWFVFNIVRYLTLPGAYTTHSSMWVFMQSQQVLIGQIIVPIALIFLYALSGYYNRPFFKSRVDEFVNTMMSTFIAMLGIYFIALLNDNIPERLKAYEIMLILWGLLFSMTFIFRSIISYTARRKVRCGKVIFPTAVVGDPAEALAMARSIHERPSRGMKVSCILSTSDYLEDSYEGIPVYPLSEAKKICGMYGIRNFVLVPADGTPGCLDRQMKIITTLYPLDRAIFICPEFSQQLTMRPRLTDVANVPLLTDVSAADISPLTQNLKRAGDIVASAVSIAILSPVLTAIAILIKAENPDAPVFYRQSRIGYHKKPFKIIKFRTMRPDAEAAGPALSSPDDSRVTRIGRTLRRYRLDELPQFWNVLRGEMSLVGPRPEREYYIERIVARVPYYSLIHQVRPGITSWGMVRYGYAENIDQMVERLRYDLLYVGNVSFAVDMKILLNTVSTVLAGRGM